MHKKQSTIASRRLFSLDALRGFDMLWIIGGDALVRHLAELWPAWAPIATQMHHAEWIGLRAYDMIFPLFMFISGVAIPFSFSKQREQGAGRNQIFRKVLRRAVILVILGVIYNGGLSFVNVRFPSVLGQIGIAYLIASVIYLYTNNVRQRIIWMFGIMAGIAGLQLFFPVPGHGMGVLTAEGSINSWLDRMLLPGRLHGGNYDPEGILCTISASFMTMSGVLSGELLRSPERSGSRKTLLLIGTGLMLLLAGLLLSPVYPMIKRIWTSTYNLAAAGISMMLMAVFYWVIDVMKLRGWTLFFRVIGMNSITIYLMVRIIDFEEISNFLFRGIHQVTGLDQMTVVITGAILIEWSILYFFYRRKIFLKV